METAFIDCSNLLEFSENSSPNANAIVSCITEKFQELQIQISNLKAFVSDGVSVVVDRKGVVSTKLKTNFALKMFNIHCICYRNVEEILIELWRFFKNSSKRLHI